MRQWLTPVITIPVILPAERTDAKLVLSLSEKGKLISTNEYKILLARKAWCSIKTDKPKKIVLVDRNNIRPVFDFLSVNYTIASSIKDALLTKADAYVFSGIDTNDITSANVQELRSFVANGGKLLLLNAAAAAKLIYPEYVRDWFIPTEGDIVNMDIPEAPGFNGIEPLELRYFNNNKREVPAVCNAVLKINRHPRVEILATHIKVHGYISGEMEERAKYMQNIQGAVIIKIKDNGAAIISTMELAKGITDPVAGKLLVNLLDDLLR
jgi:hypothetical protein